MNFNVHRYVYEHRALVSELILRMARELSIRGRRHDNSKLTEPEYTGWFTSYPIIKDHLDHPDAVLSAKEEEKLNQVKNDFQVTLGHHYEANDHHPQHFGQDGIMKMNLMQIQEMLADWYACAIREGIDPITFLHNKCLEHDIPEDLSQVLLNTLTWLMERGGVPNGKNEIEKE